MRGRQWNRKLQQLILRKCFGIVYTYMESPTEPRVVSRRPSMEEQPQSPRRSPHSVSWRKLSLLATPLFLAIVNLFSAHFEKLAAFNKGDNIYEQLKQEGIATKEERVLAGVNAGKEKYRGIVRGAENTATSVVAGAKAQADELGRQGDYLGIVSGKQAEQTRLYAKPMFEHVTNLLELAQAELRFHEGIETSLDKVNLRLNYVRRIGKLSAAENGNLSREIAQRRTDADNKFAYLVNSLFITPDAATMPVCEDLQ